MTYVIVGGCLDVLDRSCMDVCPPDCIYTGSRMAYVNPEECIDCGACMDICPNQAPVQDVDLTDGQLLFLSAATEWVAQHEAMGGAITRGVVGEDHPLIDALPKEMADEY